MWAIGLIPLVMFVAAFLALGNRQPNLGWRRGLVRAAVLWGAAAVLMTEALSLVGEVRLLPLAAAWLLLGVAAGLGLARLRRRNGSLELPSLQAPRSLVARVALFSVVAIVAITAFVAWVAPPNTWDSLNYHMSRVAHWGQRGAVRHFATGIEVQNNMPPGAEILILNLYVLAGGDQLANQVEWFAMVGSLVAVSLIAKRLGADSDGQWMSAVFAATLPMGIIQATSTMNDYVVALWVAAAAVEALDLATGRQRAADSAVFLGLAIGLAMLTKPTAYPFLLLPGLLGAWGMLRNRGFTWGARALALTALLALSFNLGHFTRNLITYRHPISPESHIAVHRNTLIGVRGLVSNTLRNAALHAGTPSPHVNKAVALAVHWAHDLMRLDLNDPRTTSVGVFKISAPTTNETTAGNPLHAWLLVPTLILLLVRPAADRLRTYALLTVLTFLAFSLLFKWQVFGSRYHMPFFVLAAPVFGTVWESIGRRAVQLVLVLGLTLASWPWLLSIDSRPLIARVGISESGSIVRVPREELYFTNAPYLRQPITEVSDLIQNRDCEQIGVNLVGQGLEYLIWMALEAPRQDLWIEWMVAGTPSEIYRDPRFQPCAVVCQHCPESAAYAGLPLVYEHTEFKLFMDTRD